MGNKLWDKKFKWLLPVLVLMALVVFFPIQIEIIDALTLEPAAEYGIQVHFWRIVFEPILGLLLYFNRSIDPLFEVPMAILCVLILYLVYGLFQFKNLRSALLIRRRSIRIMMNLLMLTGIGFTFFLILLFIPLPNNTIVNNSKNDILVTTHAHTEYSHDGLTSQENLWKWHKRNGFDAFFITDHAHHKKTLEFTRRQRNRQFPMEPLVMVGQEHSGSNHMSLLGLDGSFITKGKPDSTIVGLTHQNGGAVIINHWFDGKGKEKEFYKDMGADGFEIENVGKQLYYDRTLFQELKTYCEEHGLIMLGGLDYHGYGRVCAIWNAFDIPNWHGMGPEAKEKAVLKVLRDRDQSKLKVLMYRDRPSYGKLPAVLHPVISVINYFRTLNGFQVLSWILWWIVFQLFKTFRVGRFMGWNKILAIWGIASATFMIALGLFYYKKGQIIQGYSKLYVEYSTLLLLVGGLFMGYSLLVIYIRFFRK